MNAVVAMKYYLPINNPNYVTILNSNKVYMHNILKINIV